MCIDKDWGMKKSDSVVNKVFSNLSELESFMMNYKGHDTINGNTKYDSYSIMEIGQ